MEFDSLTNRAEYFAAHYFAERLTDDLATSWWSCAQSIPQPTADIRHSFSSSQYMCGASAP